MKHEARSTKAETNSKRFKFQISKLGIVSNFGFRISSLPRNGFTLIELLLVISIIGILITLVTVTIRPIQLKSRDARRKSDLNLYLAGLDLFKTDFKLYPNHTFYLGKNTTDTGAATSSLDLGTDIAGCEGLSGAGNPTNFSVATDFTTASSDYDNAILKPGFTAVNHFLTCLKYVDRLVSDPTYGSTSLNGYQYRVSYDYVDVLVGAKLENTNDTEPKYLFNSSAQAEKRYYLGSGGTVRHLDDDSDSDSVFGGTANEFFFTTFGGLRQILNGKYLYQCNGKTVAGDIKRDDRSLSANEPITYSSNAWRANTTTCDNVDAKLDDIQSW
ncbi:MAG: type II secretion system protein [Candidatus Berkelbacteria bacterium]|nr:MAG: type II secretion system protein [Candidatus Berkelbacteria bacterium]QQG51641.1 MAG: type II secretion system protein [Candidatus Berkelbacteria bacterium]